MSSSPKGMVRQTRSEWMRIELPYGRWLCADGREVLFNRWYKPIWQKAPSGEVSPADASEWVSFTEQSWFYKDGNPPWENRASLALCEARLAEWGVPVPDRTAPRYKPRGTPGLYRDPR